MFVADRRKLRLWETPFKSAANVSYFETHAYSFFVEFLSLSLFLSSSTLFLLLLLLLQGRGQDSTFVPTFANTCWRDVEIANCSTKGTHGCDRSWRYYGNHTHVQYIAHGGRSDSVESLMESRYTGAEGFEPVSLLSLWRRLFLFLALSALSFFSTDIDRPPLREGSKERREGREEYLLGIAQWKKLVIASQYAFKYASVLFLTSLMLTYGHEK